MNLKWEDSDSREKYEAVFFGFREPEPDRKGKRQAAAIQA